MPNYPENETWNEKRTMCKYCGVNLNHDSPYCSEECKEHDSPWNWNGD
jgi:hypothetical protein